MNNFIGFVFAKGIGDERPEPDKRIHLSYAEVDSQLYGDTVTGGTIPSVSLPWEILETANLFFRKKGFEKTTIQDICNRARQPFVTSVPDAPPATPEPAEEMPSRAWPAAAPRRA